jgi:hypothetical protein
VTAPDSHREAAVLAFREVLLWTDGEVDVLAYPPRLLPPETWRRLSIRTPEGAFQAQVPPTASELRIALLALPDLKLSWAALPPGRDAVTLPAEGWPEGGRLAVAYRTPAGFEAALAYPR